MLSVPLPFAALLSAGKAATTTTTVLGPPPSVGLDPGQGDLPGSQILQDLANGVGSWALIAAMVGIVIGGVLWAFGHYSQNYQQAYNGRKGVLVSGVAAILVGAAPKIVNFFVNKGQTQ